ncbi:MAG: phosphoribosyltransferase family protein [Thermoflexales bacterium]
MQSAEEVRMDRPDPAIRQFENRRAAGDAVASLLLEFAGRQSVLVLGLPRGGIVIAAAVACRLAAPMDALLVRKLGHPLQPEFAIGAIAIGGVLEMNPGVDLSGLSAADRVRVIARERAELDRRDRIYRRGRPALDLSEQVAILVDDGLATGATMRAAILAAWRLGAREVVVGVPVGHAASLDVLTRPPYRARVLSVIRVAALQSISQHYAAFGQVSDDEVCALMASAYRRKIGHPPDGQRPEHTGEK